MAQEEEEIAAKPDILSSITGTQKKRPYSRTLCPDLQILDMVHLCTQIHTYTYLK